VGSADRRERKLKRERWGGIRPKSPVLKEEETLRIRPSSNRGKRLARHNVQTKKGWGDNAKNKPLFFTSGEGYGGTTSVPKRTKKGGMWSGVW